MIRRYMPDGSVRAIWPKADAGFLREIGRPVRAGQILVVEEPGPLAGFFYADLSPLADLTGDRRHRVCLCPPKSEYSAANADEEAYVLRHYVLTGLNRRVMTYEEWITANYPTQESAYGNCSEATLRMVGAFPELKRVAGHYYDISWGEREHWWCVAPDQRVVDPTASQFPTRGRGTYVELDPNDPRPTGQCLDCGDYVYDGKTFCSPECERATRAYMGIV
jgi:hypothetical protein